MRARSTAVKIEFQQIVDTLNARAKKVIQNNERMDSVKRLRLLRRMAKAIIANDNVIPPALKRAVQGLQAAETKVHEGMNPVERARVESFKALRMNRAKATRLRRKPGK